jgi:hypothetical protein
MAKLTALIQRIFSHLLTPHFSFLITPNLAGFVCAVVLWFLAVIFKKVLCINIKIKNYFNIFINKKSFFY